MSAHERERLSAYLDGELPVGERAEVAAHLATCRECASRLSEMATLDERARELPLNAPDGYFDTLPGRVRARVAGLSPRDEVARPHRPRTLPRWTWAAAAALILGVVTPLTLREVRREPPQMPAAAHRLPASEPEAAAVPGRLEGLLLEGADDEAAAEGPEREPRARARDIMAAPAPVFAPAPAAAPPPAAPKGSGGKTDTAEPVASATSSAQDRPAELEKDTREFAQAAPLGVAETEPLEERVAPSPGVVRQEAAVAQDALSSRAVAEPAVGEAKTRAQAPAAGGAAGEAGRRGPARADKKAVLDEDAPSFGGLARRNVPSDAAGWRERREAWRAFVAEDPEGPQADEARVRVVEAGLQAWRAGGDSRDLELAREDGAAYLARDDATLGPRVRRALESAEND